MEIFRGILCVLLALISVAVVVVILMQKGKQAGLTGAIGGSGADSFWGQNRGRSKEGRLDMITKILVGAFIVVALLIVALS